MISQVTSPIEAAKDIRVIRTSHNGVTNAIVGVDDRHTKSPLAVAHKTEAVAGGLIAKVARNIPAVVDRVGLRESTGGIGEICQDLERHRRVSHDVSVEGEETNNKKQKWRAFNLHGSAVSITKRNVNPIRRSLTADRALNHSFRSIATTCDRCQSAQQFRIDMRTFGRVKARNELHHHQNTWLSDEAHAMGKAL